MKRLLMQDGERFRIEAIDLTDERAEDGCPARDFVNGLPDAQKKRLVLLLNHHADHGPLKNTQQSRHLEDGIFEFKTSQGARLLFFYPGAPRLTVVTHGFLKGANAKDEIARAKRYRAAYLDAFSASTRGA